MNKNLKQKIISALVLIVMIVISVQLSVFSVEDNQELFVYYLDVGQGDSALIETPKGFQVLIDGGKDKKVIYELEKILPFYDRKIDMLILSHGDLDHIGGFFEILDRYQVNQIIKSNMKIDSEYEKRFFDKVKDLGIGIKEISAGDKIVIDGNIYIETYWPPLRQGSAGQALKDSNENSLVIELIHGANEFLFTGDATVETEFELLKSFPLQIDSDILKVGHHGSRTSTSQLFLDKVSPEYSIISYGENSYGHPNQEVVDRLNKTGGKIFETKKRATIVARSNGKTLDVNYFSNIQINFLQKILNSIKNMSPLI